MCLVRERTGHPVSGVPCTAGNCNAFLIQGYRKIRTLSLTPEEGSSCESASDMLYEIVKCRPMTKRQTVTLALPERRRRRWDDNLLALLKTCKDLAHKLKLAPFIIFQDVSLEDMSII